MGTRRKPGNGTVKQLPSGSWRYRITVNGKRHGGVAATEELAHDALGAMRMFVATGRSPEEALKKPRRQYLRPLGSKRPVVLFRKDPAAATSRKRHLLKKFGLTPGTYQAMLAAQGGGCAICRAEKASLRKLHVDHCHTTGKVRGLLCGKCNSLLGFAEDSLEILSRAAAYLGAHK